MSELQTVVFNLKGQLFGADTTQVFQIVRYQEVTKVPEMPDFVEGMINLRGSIVPIINLNKRFGLGDTENIKKSKILITKIDDKLAGFIVDDVTEILHLSDDEIEAAPVILQAESKEYLKKVAKRGNTLISIIDLSRVLGSKEIEILDNIA